MQPDREGNHGCSEDDEVEVLHPAVRSCYQRDDRMRHEAVARPEQPLHDGNHHEDNGAADACGSECSDHRARLPGLGGRLPHLSPGQQPLPSAVAGRPSTALFTWCCMLTVVSSSSERSLADLRLASILGRRAVPAFYAVRAPTTP